jgi:hypothetical protein
MMLLLLSVSSPGLTGSRHGLTIYCRGLYNNSADCVLFNAYICMAYTPCVALTQSLPCCCRPGVPECLPHKPTRGQLEGLQRVQVGSTAFRRSSTSHKAMAQTKECQVILPASMSRVGIGVFTDCVCYSTEQCSTIQHRVL